MSDQPRAFTEEEARKKFLDHLRALAIYWENEDRAPTSRQKLEGLAFSILNVFDGASGGFCALDLVLRPHESDKDHCRDNGENWFEDGMVINNCMLHEEFHPVKP